MSFARFLRSFRMTFPEVEGLSFDETLGWHRASDFDEPASVSPEPVEDVTPLAQVRRLAS